MSIRAKKGQAALTRRQQRRANRGKTPRSRPGRTRPNRFGRSSTPFDRFRGIVNWQEREKLDELAAIRRMKAARR